jgi:hypothetical protein
MRRSLEDITNVVHKAAACEHSEHDDTKGCEFRNTGQHSIITEKDSEARALGRPERYFLSSSSYQVIEFGR